MKKIPLRNSRKFVVVDDEDFPILSRHKWRINNTGAVFTQMVKNSVSISRFILTAPRGYEVDHKDGNRLNNQKSNLRICTRRANEINKPPTSRNTSGYKGVHKARGRWTASVGFKGKRYYLGFFSNRKDAARAYNKRAKELFGEFAWLNPV